MLKLSCCPYQVLPRPYHVCLGSVGLCVKIGSVNILLSYYHLQSYRALLRIWAAAGVGCPPPEVCRAQGLN